VRSPAHLLNGLVSCCTSPQVPLILDQNGSGGPDGHDLQAAPAQQTVLALALLGVDPELLQGAVHLAVTQEVIQVRLRVAVVICTAGCSGVKTSNQLNSMRSACDA